MTTTSHALTPEQRPLSTPNQPVLPATWLMLAQVVAKWALWASVFVSGLIGLEYDFGLGRFVTALIMAFLGFAFVSAGEGLLSLLWLILGFLLPRLGLAQAANRLKTIPPTIPGRLLSVFLYIAGDMLWPTSFLQHITIPPVGELAIILLAVTGALVTLARLGERPSWRWYAPLGVAVLLNVAYLAWVWMPGTDSYLARTATTAPMPTLTLADPGLPGSYSVQSLSYGSGADLRRAEYGPAAVLLTQPVDGSKIFGGYNGLSGSYYHWYWGFDMTRLPLNGLVWYPDGNGPFPIVLIVHGNHTMTEASELGYAYLGEHLASHGYITVSIDENFLNGMGFIDGHMEEIPLRAWLLLKHLQQWQTWNDMPGHLFYGQVDLDHIALIGHSRGGEAVAAAAAMNWHVVPPVSRVASADEFGFGIQAVVAIAPSDGHYKPGGRPLALQHSNYLLLAGGHDADTFTLYGQAQYNRVRFDHNPAGFKALAYVYQANHGQFNTVWADRDRGWLNSLLLNRRPLLQSQDQQQTALVFVTAFLEASLRGQAGYRALFANPTAGNPWLPAGIIVTQYEDAAWTAVDTNQPNSAPSQLDVPAGETWTQGMTAWQTQALMLRDGLTRQQNHALYLAWAAGSEPAVGMVWPDPISLTADHALTFALTSALEAATPIQAVIELEAANGQTAALPLSQFGPIYPPLPAYLTKAAWLNSIPDYKITVATPYERVLQTYTLPLTAFQQANPAWQPDQIQAIRFRFDGIAAGAVYLDQVGFVAGWNGAAKLTQAGKN